MKHWLLISLFTTIGLSFQGCVNDDELDFPEEDMVATTETLALYTLLNAFQLSNSNVQCFEFIFPVKLSYNIDITAEVNDIDGLLEAINSQTKGFFIEGIVLPVMVNKNGTLQSIETESDLFELLASCDIPGLKNDLDLYLQQCFGFQYPIHLMGSSGSLETIESFQSLKELIKKDDFIPGFVFPLTVVEYETDKQIEINNYYDLYQVINDCERCPELFFKKDEEFDGSVKLIADFEGRDQLTSYDWYIDGTFKKTVNTDHHADTLLHIKEAGEYEVCLKASTEDCVAGVEYCENVVVKNYCPELFFSYQQEGDIPVYYFFAEFPLMNEIEYTWAIYKNNDLVIWETEHPTEGDDQFNYQFEPGVYEICIEVEGFDDPCPIAKYCKVLTVE